MNTNKKIIIIALSALAIGLMLGWLIFGGSSSESKMNENHQHTTEIAVETVWTCSMHPQIRQNEPGDCPICGMDLIPLDDQQDEQLDPMAISMSATAMQLADIRTATVGSMDPIKSVRLNGKVQVDERLVYSQSSHIPGRIEKLLVNFTGQFVRKGQTIAYIYSPEMLTAQEELFEAQKIKDAQPQLFKSAKEKLKNWKLTDSQVEQILKAGTPKEQFAIQADVSGYVMEKMVNNGDYIRQRESIYEIADLSKVWLLFDVYESDMAWIKKGDKVNFTVASLPGEVFEGKISFVDPIINPNTRVAKARVEVSNSKLTLKPEMFVSGLVEATLPKHSNQVVAPKTAVMWTGKRSLVYVKEQSYQGVYFKMREVVLGPSLGDSYVIKEGLKAGEEIAVNGTFSIDAAAQLAGKPSMMNQNNDLMMRSDDRQMSQDFKEDFNLLIVAYLAIKNALVDDNLKEAVDKLKTFKSYLNTLNSSDYQHISKSTNQQIKNALQHIQQLKTIAELRITFQQISEGMIDMAETFNATEQTLYVQHCPMAGNSKGAAWLSAEPEVRNPYFGSAMLRCGEVINTISK